jgi:hypothetical protein
MFSVSLQRTGALASMLVPSDRSPRQKGHGSAGADDASIHNASTVSGKVLIENPTIVRL